MTQPLKLPAWLKNIGRAVRDWPVTNNMMTACLRPLVRRLPSSVGASLISRVPRIGMAKVRLPNGRVLRMYSVHHESVLSAIYYYGWVGDERETLPLWFSLAENARTIIDVGAHVGLFSIVAGLANPRAQIQSLEPLPRVADLFEKNVRLNDVKNVSIQKIAAGRSSGTARFYAVPDGIPSSSSLSKDFMVSGGHAALDELNVRVVPLDQMYSELESPVLIKIDTETTEPDVIAGARRIISQTQPVIFVEVLADYDTGPAIESELRSAGYRYTPYLMTDDGLEIRSEIRGDTKGRNYLLIPVQGPTIAGLGDALATQLTRCVRQNRDQTNKATS